MALAPGTRLGPYEVTAQIGVGGMGEVYRATDTKLKRQVAIKVLPGALAGDADRLARFQREAEVLASLNHPGIAHIYGVEDADGSKALVMELVEGPTLADRIAHGAIPFDEALHIAKQIAEALEAAHEQGIVHRDLKPANIKVRPDGTVKVLDFGLAKAMDPAGTASPNASMSPTITTPAMTAAGIILGTAAYMSPEQARGKPVDKRTDIWAFGCVLYEMLTGQRAFEGGDVSMTLSKLLQSEPEFETLAVGSTAGISQVVRACLRKDPKQRVHDIADVRLALEGAFQTEIPVASDRQPRRPWTLVGMFVAGAAVAGAAVAIVVWAGESSSSEKVAARLSITLPDGLELTGGSETFAAPVVISPDGRRIAYSATDGNRIQVYMRDLDSFETRHLVGTDGGTSPFFSPDSEWLGFFADGRMKRMRASGGTPTVIAQTPTYLGTGVEWGADGLIRFTASSVGSGLWQVPADGGVPERVTTVNTERGEYAHSYPQLLPSGRHVLFTIWGGPGAGIAVLDLETREWHTVIPNASGAMYLATGHLAYRPSISSNEAQLMAVQLDSDSFEPVGTPVPVLVAVDEVPRAARITASVSRTGTLAYVPRETSVAKSLVHVDRDGTVQPVAGLEPAHFLSPRFSPGGERLAFTLFGGDVWILDLNTGTRTRHSIRGGYSPAWTPDGGSLVFTSNRHGAFNLYGKRVGAEGEADQLLTEPLSHFPISWSRDGTTLLLEVRSPVGGIDVYYWQNGALMPFLATEFDEGSPTFSPNGRFVAYVSNESGRRQVQVAGFPDPGRIVTVSTEGGSEPLWSPDGTELFYRHGRSVMAIDVATVGTFQAGPPRKLFEGDFAADLYTDWDVTPDGRRFLMVMEDPDRPRTIRIVQDWFQELNRLVPAN